MSSALIDRGGVGSCMRLKMEIIVLTQRGGGRRGWVTKFLFPTVCRRMFESHYLARGSACKLLDA